MRKNFNKAILFLTPKQSLHYWQCCYKLVKPQLSINTMSIHTTIDSLKKHIVAEYGSQQGVVIGSDRELAQATGISRGKIREALAALTYAGELITEHGKKRVINKAISGIDIKLIFGDEVKEAVSEVLKKENVDRILKGEAYGAYIGFFPEDQKNLLPSGKEFLKAFDPILSRLPSEIDVSLHLDESVHYPSMPHVRLFLHFRRSINEL